jgi:hypothetical protein
MLAPDGQRLFVHGRWGDVEVTDRSEVVQEALSRMSLGPVSLENISALYDNFVRWRLGFVEPCEEWDRLHEALDTLGGYVVASLGHADASGPLLSAVAERPDAVFALPMVLDDEPIGVRPRATILHVNDELALVCPAAPYRVVLHRAPTLTVAQALLTQCPATIAQLADTQGLDRRLVADIVAYLIGAGIVFSVHVET